MVLGVLGGFWEDFRVFRMGFLGFNWWGGGGVWWFGEFNGGGLEVLEWLYGVWWNLRINQEE